MNDVDARSRLDSVVTPAQLRAARGLLNLSVSELARRTGLAMNTVRKAEDPHAPGPVTTANAQLLRSTLEACGVVFIEVDTMGAGVRLRDPGHEPSQRRRSPSGSGAN